MNNNHIINHNNNNKKKESGLSQALKLENNNNLINNNNNNNEINNNKNIKKKKKKKVSFNQNINNNNNVINHDINHNIYNYEGHTKEEDRGNDSGYDDDDESDDNNNNIKNNKKNNNKFRPSYQDFTPSIIKNNSLKYKNLDQRMKGEQTNAVIAPPSSVSRPNYKDVLRRVSVVIHQHIGKCVVALEHSERQQKMKYLEAKLKEKNDKKKMKNIKNENEDDIDDYDIEEEDFEEGPYLKSKIDIFDEEQYLSPQFCYHFLRLPTFGGGGGCYSLQKIKRIPKKPKIEEILNFMLTLFIKAHLSSECSIVSLIYIEKLMEHAEVPLLPNTWRPIVLCGLLLASKVWQDLSSWNIEFSMIYPQFTLSGINRLERMFVHHINWDLFISSSLYAKYYFALRSLTEQTDFRRRYNYIIQVNPPNAKELQQRSNVIKQDLSELLSKSV